MSEGRTNKDIAADLNLAEHTIENYVSEILALTGAANRTEFAIRYVKDDSGDG
ncbi:MAG: response regulator transcription factor [Tepidiformaceae bacterium]